MSSAPEGGLTDGEVVAFRAGRRPVRLGAEVLRTSTAGAAALAALCSRPDPVDVISSSW